MIPKDQISFSLLYITPWTLANFLSRLSRLISGTNNMSNQCPNKKPNECRELQGNEKEVCTQCGIVGD